MSAGIIIDRKDGIQLFTYKAVISAIKLEKLGMKHSRGSVRKNWAIHLGLKPTAKHDIVIAALQVKCTALEQAGDLGIRSI